MTSQRRCFARELQIHAQIFHNACVAIFFCSSNARLATEVSVPSSFSSFDAFFSFLHPTSSVHFSSTDAGSSSQLSSFAGGEACNWRCLTMNQTTLHATRLADIAPATPSHGPGLQLSPCGNSTSVHNRFIIFTS